MKDLSTYINSDVDEHLLSALLAKAQFKPDDPKHYRLFRSFMTWFNGMREKYNDDLILNMIDWAEQDIRMGEI